MSENALIAREQALEEEAIGYSPERYRRIMESQTAAESVPGRRMMTKVIPQFLEALEGYLTDCAKGIPARSAGIVGILEQADVETVAFLTAQEVINACAGGRKLTRTAGSLGRRVEESINHDRLKREDPAMYKKLERHLKGQTNAGYRPVALRRFVKRSVVKEVKWGPVEEVRLGLLLIELFIEATGYAQTVLQPTAEGDRPYILVPTEEVSKWMERANASAAFSMPLMMPMVVPPRPWAPGKTGGYLNPKLRRPLVRRAPRALLSELADREMPDAYNALNAIQSTPWTIEPAVLRVVQALWDEGGGVAGLPTREERTPAFQHPGPGGDPEVIAQWKKEAHTCHRLNALDRSKRLGTAQVLWVAQRFSKEARFYFPHNLDFRGRVYPIPLFLNPQGDDLCRGLLTFADGVPLGSDGQFWLAVHGANCYGVDKLSFEERAAWVEEHEREILDAALRPLEHREFWMAADKGSKPWQFLAFCSEWARMRMHEAAGLEFHSSLPVGWDGSCNGLQHYSALLRDAEGGAATNLIPSEKPADIYARVAEAAERVVARDADAGGEKAPFARNWMGKVSRPIAKRPTMTMPYGAGRYGYSEQINGVLDKDFPADYLGDPGEHPQQYRFRHAVYLADVMLEAVPSVVRKAAEAMDWLQKVAALVAKRGVPVSWTAPSGFLVRQGYWVQVGHALDINFLGERHKLQLRIDTEKVDARRQRVGIAPNFVHALDAAHLAATVSAAHARGVTSFAVVHDSFGSHAGHATALHACLRERFVEQYRGAVLERFHEEMRQTMEAEDREKIPPLPQAGSLELEGVLDSWYFFA